MQWKKANPRQLVQLPPCNWNPCGYSATLIFGHRNDSIFYSNYHKHQKILGNVNVVCYKGRLLWSIHPTREVYEREKVQAVCLLTRRDSGEQMDCKEQTAFVTKNTEVQLVSIFIMLRLQPPYLYNIRLVSHLSQEANGICSEGRQAIIFLVSLSKEGEKEGL